MDRLTHLSLFSGIGGLDLAAEWAGFETVGQCEWADYPTRILEKHWPDVPRWRDIRTLTKESFYERTGLRTVDVISGGFPCQPFSCAGKQRSKDDDRYLWPEMLRVIRELRPSWVLGENVPGIVNLALDEVSADLEGQGYEVQTFIVPACGVDAPHKRERVAIIGHRQMESKHRAGEWGTENVENANRIGLCKQKILQKQPWRAEPERNGQIMAHSTGIIIDRGRHCAESTGWGEFANGSRWPAEPGVGRVANGIPHRVDRIRCLGNAVVPQQFYLFFKLIADIERRGTP